MATFCPEADELCSWDVRKATRGRYQAVALAISLVIADISIARASAKLKVAREQHGQWYARESSNAGGC